MKYYLILLCLPFVNCLQTVSQKQYNLKVEKTNVLMFSGLTALIGLCFFVITSGFHLDFIAAQIPYALVYAVAYASAWVGTVLSIQYGSVALSTMIVSCSLIFPTGYGILLGEKVTPSIVIGVLLLFSAIVLVNLKKDKDAKFSLKWFASVMAAFLGNGICSVTQNIQKRTFGDDHAHEFMIIALFVAFLLLMGLAIARSRDPKGDIRACFRFTLLNGSANGMVNLMLILLIGNIPNTILYPTVAGMNMVILFLLSFFAYKERFSVKQYIGYGLGTAAVILLNL